jgi:hypothetical protein
MYGLKSTEEQLRDHRDSSESGVVLVHVDTCVGCYLQDHHNRDGECLFGVHVDGDSTYGSVRLALVQEIASTSDRVPDYVTDAQIDAAVSTWFDGLDLAHTFDSRLDSPPQEHQFDSEEEFEAAEREWEDEAGESCQAWFVLTWNVPEEEPEPVRMVGGSHGTWDDAMAFQPPEEEPG